MNLEERAKQFVDGYDASFIGPMRLERIAKCAADFASEAVKAEREKIADELEADADGTCGTDDLFKKVRRHIDRLRGERE